MKKIKSVFKRRSTIFGVQNWQQSSQALKIVEESKEECKLEDKSAEKDPIRGQQAHKDIHASKTASHSLLLVSPIQR